MTGYPEGRARVDRFLGGNFRVDDPGVERRQLRFSEQSDNATGRLKPEDSELLDSPQCATPPGWLPLHEPCIRGAV